MPRNHHGPHAKQVWQYAKHPLGRKLTWKFAARIALNWMEGRPLMRRPIPIKLLYRVSKELEGRLNADLALDMQSPLWQWSKGTHVVLDTFTGELKVRYDSAHPEINWADENTWPTTICFPEGPTASSFGRPVDIPGTGRIVFDWLWDKECKGITTIATGSAFLQHYTIQWVNWIQSKLVHKDGAHGAYLKHRVERIGMNVLCNMVIRLFPYILPGGKRARHYGSVVTKKEEFDGNYFYLGYGPGYNGHPCQHLPPGPPAWSRSQYIFKQYLFKVRRRKGMNSQPHPHGYGMKADGTKDKRVKSYREFAKKIKVPPLRGRNLISYDGGGDGGGRPRIGRRWKKKVGRSLKAQLEYAFEHPLHVAKARVEKTLRSRWTMSALNRDIANGRNTYKAMQRDLHDFFSREMVHDLCEDIGKNISKVAKRRFTIYKKQIINAIADPVLEYGVQKTVEVMDALDPKRKWIPHFEQDNPFDKLLFQANPESSFPEDYFDGDKRRY